MNKVTCSISIVFVKGRWPLIYFVKNCTTCQTFKSQIQELQNVLFQLITISFGAFITKYQNTADIFIHKIKKLSQNSNKYLPLMNQVTVFFMLVAIENAFPSNHCYATLYSGALPLEKLSRSLWTIMRIFVPTITKKRLHWWIKKLIFFMLVAKENALPSNHCYATLNYE